MTGCERGKERMSDAALLQCWGNVSPLRKVPKTGQKEIPLFDSQAPWPRRFGIAIG